MIVMDEDDALTLQLNGLRDDLRDMEVRLTAIIASASAETNRRRPPLPESLAKLAAEKTPYQRAIITMDVCSQHIDDYRTAHPVLAKLGIEFPIRKWRRLYATARDLALREQVPGDDIED